MPFLINYFVWLQNFEADIWSVEIRESHHKDLFDKNSPIVTMKSEVFCYVSPTLTSLGWWKIPIPYPFAHVWIEKEAGGRQITHNRVIMLYFRGFQRGSLLGLELQVGGLIRGLYFNKTFEKKNNLFLKPSKLSHYFKIFTFTS